MPSKANELFGMWTNTRMIVLTAVVAALYVCILIPFKVFPIIPGWTEFRPAVLVPLLGSLLFGPAAAWGAAMGNVVGDVFGGMFGIASIFGFVGNFLLGFLPYKLLENISTRNQGESKYAVMALVGVIASVACATFIAWGVDLLGFMPFPVLAGAISINNSVFALLYPTLFFLLYHRIKRMGLLYTQVLPSYQPRAGSLRRLIGLFLVIGGTAGALLLGLILNAAGAGDSIKFIVAPFCAAIVAGCLML